MPKAKDGLTLMEKSRLIRDIATSTAESNARVVAAFNKKLDAESTGSAAALATDFIRHNKDAVSPLRDPIPPKGKRPWHTAAAYS
jgi:hypothetical protein